MDDKYQEFNGILFCKDENTGYYLNSTIHERMHRYVWKYYCGEIPNGFHIHHIDGDKSNNSIDNLCMMTNEAHQILHGKEEARKAVLRENLEKYGRPAAIKWHKSEEGRAWHSKKQLQTFKDAKPKKFICQNCGKEFEALPFGNHNFCSNSCKSAYRRKNGIDNEIRICEICGKEFEINKYSKTRFCSKKCVGINRSRINEEKRKVGIPVVKTKNRSD